MKLFVTLASVLAAAGAAPHTILGALNYGVAPATYHGTTVQEHVVPAGPAIHKTHVQHGVVGSRTIQVGTKTVQVGHQYGVAGQTVHPRPDETYVAEPAKAYTNTVALPEPALPYAAGAVAPVIPAAPTNQGPAPADTVTHTKILAPGRTHNIVTPQVTRIEPQLQVNQVPYDVIQNVPVPVEREVIVQKEVIKPYRVDVEQPYHVPVPVPVDTVRDQYVTPVVHKHTSSVSHPVAVQQVAYTQPAAHVAYAQPAAAAHVAYAQASPVAYTHAHDIAYTHSHDVPAAITA